jgi:hypothetical protein
MVQVCAFNLVDHCQEYLREHNEKPDSSAEKQSMWHQWQQRIAVVGSAVASTSPQAAHGVVVVDHAESLPLPLGTMQFDWGSDLFGDDDDMLVARAIKVVQSRGGAVKPELHVQVRGHGSRGMAAGAPACRPCSPAATSSPPTTLHGLLAL